MRVLFLPIAAIALIANGQPPLLGVPIEGFDAGRLAERISLARPIQCADRIRPVKVEEVQVRINPPRVQREPAAPEEAMAIWAVDRREKGCGVMVMMGDLNDVRPLPEVGDGPAQRIEIGRD